jgi:hypothetical protein
MIIKKTVLVILVVWMLASAVNYFTGTSIVINGQQVTGVGQYVTAFAALILLSVVLVIAITSGFILAVVLVLFFGIFIMLLFPLLPLAFLLLPGVILICVAYLVYKIRKTQQNKKALS